MKTLGFKMRKGIFLGNCRLPIILLFLGIAWMEGPPLASSTGFKSPEECLAYTGDAHLNCVYAYIEIQKEKILKLEEVLNSLKGTTKELQERVDRQASVTKALQRRIEDQRQNYQGFRYPRFRPSLGLFYYSGLPYRYGGLFGPYYGLQYGPYYPYW